MISTHVLDTTRGQPASGISIRLEKIDGKTVQSIASGKTNEDGRFVFDCEKVPGTYKLVFDLEDYFKKHSLEAFFPCAPVVFKIENTKRKYHVPLLLSPYGYSTYRGS